MKSRFDKTGPSPADFSGADGLDETRLKAALAATEITLDVYDEVDSTNSVLAGIHHRHRHVVLAEFQRQGRGRRGNTWVSPPGSGLCLSFGYVFQSGLRTLGPLSLAAGIVVAEQLRAMYALDVRIKWPNDLIHGLRKLGGLLIELQAAGAGGCRAIIGVGLNVHLPEEAYSSAPAIEDETGGRGWTDLHQALDCNQRIDRTELAIALSIALAQLCTEFDQRGFKVFIERWTRLDSLNGRTVLVRTGTGEVLEGVAGGISPAGGLYLNTGSDCLELKAAEVSVRGA